MHGPRRPAAARRATAVGVSLQHWHRSYTVTAPHACNCSGRLRDAPDKVGPCPPGQAPVHTLPASLNTSETSAPCIPETWAVDTCTAAAHLAVTARHSGWRCLQPSGLQQRAAGTENIPAIACATADGPWIWALCECDPDIRVPAWFPQSARGHGRRHVHTAKAPAQERQPTHRRPAYRAACGRVDGCPSARKMHAAVAAHRADVVADVHGGLGRVM